MRAPSIRCARGSEVVPFTKGLHRLCDDTWAWLGPDGGFGWSNAGLIRGGARTLLVDTLFDLRLTQEMLDAMAPIIDESPLTDVVNTHANGDHCYGNQLLPAGARIHAAPEVAGEMHEAPPEMLAAMSQMDLGPVLTPYVRRRVGAFDFTGIQLRDPDTAIEDSVSLDLDGLRVDMVKLGPAHTHGDVVVWVPDRRVLFAGDLLFIDGTPIMWAGPIENWIAACDAMLGWQPEIVVPGHGPVTGVDGIRAVRDYLVHVEGQLSDAIAAGKEWKQAAWDIDLGPFATLPDADRVVVTAYQTYRNREPDTPEQTVVELFTSMAEWELERVPG